MCKRRSTKCWPPERFAPQTKSVDMSAYRAKDPEGHIWTFGVTVQRMKPEQWDEASGLKTRMRLD
jgi:hypothetical protein